jgi:hypothetical protein
LANYPTYWNFQARIQSSAEEAEERGKVVETSHFFYCNCGMRNINRIPGGLKIVNREVKLEWAEKYRRTDEYGYPLPLTYEDLFNAALSELTVFDFGLSILAGLLIVYLLYRFICRRLFVATATATAAAAPAAASKAAAKPPAASACSDGSALAASQSMPMPSVGNGGGGGGGSGAASMSLAHAASPNSSSLPPAASSRRPPPPPPSVQSPVVKMTVPSPTTSSRAPSASFDPLAFSKFPSPIVGDVAAWRAANPSAAVASLAGRSDLTDDDLCALAGVAALDISHAAGRSRGALSGTGLAACAPSLTVLHARGSVHLAPDALARMRRLVVLDASHALIDAASLAALGKADAPLHTLYIFGCTAPLLGAGALAPIAKTLKRLDAGYCDVDDAAIAPCAELESLDVSGVASAGLLGGCFVALPQLTTLKARNCASIRSAAVRALKANIDVNVYGCSQGVVEAADERQSKNE